VSFDVCAVFEDAWLDMVNGTFSYTMLYQYKVNKLLLQAVSLTFCMSVCQLRSSNCVEMAKCIVQIFWYSHDSSFLKTKLWSYHSVGTWSAGEVQSSWQQQMS